jgi:hypothetical protein
MTFQQSRVPAAFLTFVFGSLAAFVGFCTIMAGREPPTDSTKQVLAIFIIATGIFVGLGALSCLFLWRPMVINIDANGIRFSGLGRVRSWGWTQVSQFRLGPRGYTILFEVSETAQSKSGVLPAEWPGGSDLMIARLNAAQRQYTNPAEDGPTWQDVQYPNLHPVRQFAVGLTLGLLTCLGLFLFGLSRLHH